MTPAPNLHPFVVSRSPVAHTLGVGGVVGSNPATPTYIAKILTPMSVIEFKAPLAMQSKSRFTLNVNLLFFFALFVKNQSLFSLHECADGGTRALP